MAGAIKRNLSDIAMGTTKRLINDFYNLDSQGKPDINSPIDVRDWWLYIAVKTEPFDNDPSDATAIIKKSVHYLQVASSADLSSITNSTIYDRAYVEDEGIVYAYNGTSWEQSDEINIRPAEGKTEIYLSDEDTLVAVDSYYYSIDMRKRNQAGRYETYKMFIGKVKITPNTVNEKVGA